jgi:hypothetical protein
MPVPRSIMRLVTRKAVERITKSMIDERSRDNSGEVARIDGGDGETGGDGAA